jgi:ABC-type glycerol-3-phosphate transport system substrate-binding protein
VNNYLGRYFVPLTEELNHPNPFNRDNPALANVNWKDTFKDGLENSYIPDLLDYYGVGFSQFTIRIFYNKDLARRVIGNDEAPKTLQELFAKCDAILAYVDRRNVAVKAHNDAHPLTWWQRTIPFVGGNQRPMYQLVPIASANYQVNLFRGRYSGMLTADRCRDLDTGLDGNLGWQEVLAAMLEGRLTLEDEKYRVSQELIRRLSRYFTPGFMSVDRMDSGFSFVQGRALMITSGSWDASSFIKQIKDQPFGDILLEIDGNAVASVDEAAKVLMAVPDGQPVSLSLDREGGRSSARLRPVPGPDLWTRYGLAVEDCVAADGRSVPTVTEVDAISPASEAGLFARKQFEVGICDFPLPTKDDPEYGKYFVGSIAETTQTGFSFGIVKFSKHIKESIEFLQFCTTTENNQKMNEIAQWIPAVKGAEATGYLKAFEPNFEGYWNWLNFNMGQRTGMIESQIFWPYISGDYSYDEYIDRLRQALPEAAAVDYQRMVRSAQEAIPDKQVRRSIYLAKMLFADDERERSKAEKKYAESWDILRNFEVAQARMASQLKVGFAKKDNNEFSKAFFESYERIADK